MNNIFCILYSTLGLCKAFDGILTSRTEFTGSFFGEGFLIYSGNNNLGKIRYLQKRIQI